MDAILREPCSYYGSVFAPKSTVKPLKKGHIGDGPVLSIVERLSSSWRFSFKPIGNFLKMKNNPKTYYVLLHFDGFFNSRMARATLIS